MGGSIYSKEQHHLIKKLREARELVGLTQSEAAGLLRKTQSYISKIESGQRRVDVVQLKQLGKIYNKAVNFFIKE